MDNANGAATSAAPAFARARVRWVIDARRSKFTVQAFATGILSAMGHNPTIGIRTFSGDIEFDPVALEAWGLRITIQSASLEVLDDLADKDRREMERLMKNDVLEVSRYPQITYDASTVAVNRVDANVYSSTLSGILNFHGVTRDQSVTARILDSGDTLRASGDFTLRQSNYQIKPVSVAGGALKLKDELKFVFEIIARRKEPPP